VKARAARGSGIGERQDDGLQVKTWTASAPRSRADSTAAGNPFSVPMWSPIGGPALFSCARSASGAPVGGPAPGS
jgi:hypothetical protein